MSRHFNSAVRTRFSAGMVELDPRFVPWKGKSAHLWPGERAWVRRADGMRCAWIVLCPSAKGYNEFTIELGWSTRDRFPELSGRPSLEPPMSQAAWARDEYLTRIGALLDGGDVHWGHGTINHPLSEAEAATAIYESALALTATLGRDEADRIAAPLVDQALDAVRRVGLPYLEQWVERG